MTGSIEPKAVMVNVLKGGIGKTTVTKNTANALGEDSRVLVMDTDDNGHLTKHLGFEEEFKRGKTFANVLDEYDDTEVVDIIQPTKFNFDFIPATHHTEVVEAKFKNKAMNMNLVLKKKLVDPFLEDYYDYILFDTPANRSLLTLNAAVAAGNLIMPISSGEQGKDGIRATMQRIYRELNEEVPGGMQMLAMVPNKINDRLDQQTNDRQMLEEINTAQIGNGLSMDQWVPNFARIPSEIWEKIDAGELASNPKPGIRTDKALDNKAPVHEVDPQSESIEYFDELAEIVKYGGVQRQDNITETLIEKHGGTLA